MLRQTVRPKKIILWLSDEQFKEQPLPHRLTELVGDYFEIRFVKGDIRSHKKYHYVLNEYPQSLILLIDDDLYYPTNMLEKMIDYSERYKDSVICRYGNIMKYNKDGLPLPYKIWWPDNKLVTTFSENVDFFFGTGGGCLLKKSLLYKDVLDIEKALSLAPIADDVWINAMVNLGKTKKIKIPCGLLMEITNNSNKTLCSENVGENKNDSQISKVNSYYKEKIGVMPFFDGKAENHK
jgi:hypothetical protein